MIPSWTDDEVYLVAVRGHNLFLQGCYAEAVAIFEGLRIVRPSDLYCANALAALYIRLEKIERAINILSDALASHPNDTETRARRCEAYVMAGRFGEAFEDGKVLKHQRFGSGKGRLELLLRLADKSGSSKQLSNPAVDND